MIYFSLSTTYLLKRPLQALYIQMSVTKMKQLCLIILCFLSLAPMAAQPDKKYTTEEYIDGYKQFAVIEMHNYGIPASITMAQGILESSSGNSRLAREGNNHFGIKCKSDWTGKTIYADDDAPNECFRAYDTPLESFKDHSDFLKNNWRYQDLFKLEPTDYKGWADGLRKAGYATNPKYHEILINLIERYQLHKLDLIQPEGGVTTKTIKNNDIPAVYVHQGETIESVAKENDLPAGRIYKWNDIPKGTEITEGDILYLKPKKRKGSEAYHVVESGEDMHDISQMYGIKLKHLYKKNHMEYGEEPKVGEKIYMQHKRDRDDKVETATGSEAGQKLESKPQNTKPFVNPNNLPKSENTVPAAMPEFHVVESGDNIYRIAEKYHVLEEDLLTWNRIDALSLKVGQKIYLTKEAAAKNITTPAAPVKVPDKKAASTAKYHTVASGETVYRICTQYGITAEQLQKWNNLKGNTIYEGQKLQVSE